MTSPRLRIGVCLSMTGRFARFGVQAWRGLETWRSLTGAADLVIEDDCSDPEMLERALTRVAARCDLLLGPYSTQLVRRAGDFAAEHDLLLWNHGGSGDDVETAHPGHLVSVLTPTSRYAESFIRLLAARAEPGILCIAQGRGAFGRQVADGAEKAARTVGIASRKLRAEEELPEIDSPWHLFSTGIFEDDVQRVRDARRLANPPHIIGSVAAGVAAFAVEVPDPTGIYGVGQWAPGSGQAVEIGPDETTFTAAYGATPDYPATQAAATAVIATHCLHLAGSTTREALWPVAAALETTTLFGPYKIDPISGLQTGHEASLVRWDGRRAYGQ